MLNGLRGLSGFKLALFFLAISGVAHAQGQETESCAEFDAKATCAHEADAENFTLEALSQEMEVKNAFNRYYHTDIQVLPTEAQKTELLTKLYTKLQEFSGKYYCKADFEISTFSRVYYQFDLDQELRNTGSENNERTRSILAKDELSHQTKQVQAAKEDLLTRIHESSTELNYCADHPRTEIFQEIAELEPPCELVLNRILPDNEYRVERILPDIKNSPEYQSAQKCIQERGASLRKVTIFASSNQLNNTSPEFCKKDFMGLSKARAERAQAVLLPELLRGIEQKVEVELHYQGKNRNGSSGPCPYHRVASGANASHFDERFIEGFKSDPVMKAELEKGKYLVIRFEFNGQKNEMQGQSHLLSQLLPCSSIRVGCAQ